MTIYGSDVSHYDQVDPRSMFADGISFQTHKAGGDQNDPTIGMWWRYVQPYRAKMLFGAYWVLYPGNPAVRAHNFVQRLDDQCDGWRDGPFILQVDAEIWNGDQSTKPSIGEINAFCDQLTVWMPKLNPIVYAPEWVYGDSVSALRYPTWASAYVNGAGHYRDLYPGDGAKQWNAYGGRGPSILQYSSKATIGGQSTCDVNAFRGTLAQLINLTSPGWSNFVGALQQDDYDKIAQAVWAQQGGSNGTYGGQLQTTFARAGATSNIQLPALAQAVASILTNVQADDGDKQQLLDAISQAEQQGVQDLIAGLQQSSDEEVADALKAALGDRSAAIGALLAG